MIPKTEKSLDKAFDRCNRQKVFIQITKDSYSDYAEEALSDFSSALKDLEQRDLKWAVVKAYQALFLQCTAVIVKNLGIYSKDHGCLILAMLKNNLIRKDILEKVSNMLDHKQSLYEEIDKIRIFRNKALYFPKTQSKIGGKEEVAGIIEEARLLISAIGEQL